MAQGKTIRVVLGGRAGGTNAFARRPPLISVHLASDPTWTPAKKDWPAHKSKIYWALLDTGADFCSIDEAASTEIGAKIVGNGTVHGFTGTTKHAGYTNGQVLLPSAQQVFETRFSVMDFRGAGQPWDVVLGRNFLRHCHFVVNGPAERYDLEWIGATALTP